ncbi:hypothetical protein GS597_13905 [Synechococcales cyanobacterium C]|uniref:ATP-binding protein n=1 Tax=Petrachloros mirabilis ULC683 TaxID=2781853 RepID=A0A8K2A1A1_9CYAN|nr:hypothetical protein [Petrachloros mirabilis]NCJ07582.1 hypothetical protein [Petrachloros mirabilis ULC683]
MADSLRASEQGLKIVDEARRKRGWNKTAASWCNAAATAEATLKRFWRGLPILRDTFIEICAAVGVTDWEAIAASELDLTMEHWWAGRRALLRDLTAVLQGDCRLLVITGITGLGKTALGNRLAVDFGDPWQKDGVNFDAYEQPPTFVTVATQWLQSWHEAPTTEEQQNPEMLRHRLIQKLKQEPYWLQIDPLKIHAYTRTLARQVQARVEKAFERLRRDAFDAYVLLCQVAIYREPVSETFWLSHLQDYPWYFEPARQEAALDALRDRYLVEEQLIEDEVRLRLHTLIRSVALEHLKKLEMPQPPS